MTAHDGTLAALIARGEGRPDAIDPHTLLDAAETHHVVPLVSRALDAIDPHAPASRAMHAAAAAWALREQSESGAIRSLLDVTPDLPILFIKGAATAYGLYAEPWMRMREDWDLLVAPGAAPRVRAALAAAAFEADHGTKPGAVRMRQQSYRRDVAGSQCVVDVHACVLNPPALADAIGYADLERDAVPLPSLHAAARGPGDAAALVLAAAHRLAHHSGEPRLAWDCDVLFLLRRLDEQQAERAVFLARSWGLSPLVEAEVRRVGARFNEPLAPHVRALIDALARGGASVSAAAHPFLRENRSRAREFALDWRALDWSGRLALVRETLVPDPAYMRARGLARGPRAFGYAWRIVRGVVGWFRR